jgi:hypothetical protein
MKGLAKLELRYGRYAIKNLTLYIAALNLAVFLLTLVIYQGNILSTELALGLFPQLVLKGQVWRLITFIFLPNTYHPIWILFSVYLTYMIGASLENYWGRFRLNLYFLVGMLGTIIAAFITGYGSTGYYLNLTMFLAYATLFPEQQFMLFFVLPVKVKYLGLLNAGYILYEMIYHIQFRQWHMVAAILVSLLNYFLFFGEDFIKWIKLKRQVAKNRRRFFEQVRPYDRDRDRRY